VNAPRPSPPPLAAGELPPKKVAWLHPSQLLRTAYHVWLSTTAKEYIDKRETLAALGAIPAPEDDPLHPGVLDRGDTIDARTPNHYEAEGLWIDFVADMGDSWDATYAVATQLAKSQLQARGYAKSLPRAQVVVLGGDLVYPTPSRDRYRLRLRSAFQAALPGFSNGQPRPCLFALPGNHDWYDGLTSFVREFCQSGDLGGWRMMQRRSYFAVKLTPGWWLWGIDIALDTRIDPPQQAYFLNVMRNRTPPDDFVPGDNIILCTPKPAWTESSKQPSESYRNLNHFVYNIVTKHGGHVRVILAGDLHHYSRYANESGDQMITAGGGGAYLTGTQHLPYRVADLALGQASGDCEPAKDLPSYGVTEFPYPSRSDSRRLALGALLLAFRPANWGFTFLAMGGLYALFVWNLSQVVDIARQRFTGLARVPIEMLLAAPDGGVWLLIAVALGAGAVVTAASERAAHRLVTMLWGVLHGLLHLIAAVAVAWVLLRVHIVDRILPWLPAIDQLPERFRLMMPDVVFYSAVVVFGGLLGATLVGLYFVLSDFLFGWHTNEVFASQSIIDYRNFLRLHIDPDRTLRIYPIGVRKVPTKWRLRLNRVHADEPYYEPTLDVVRPHLIEGPITVKPRR
jgi:hypothetical protein